MATSRYISLSTLSIKSLDCQAGCGRIAAIRLTGCMDQLAAFTATPARELTQPQGANKCLTVLRYGAGDVGRCSHQLRLKEVCGAQNGVNLRAKHGLSKCL